MTRQSEALQNGYELGSSEGPFLIERFTPQPSNGTWGRENPLFGRHLLCVKLLFVNVYYYLHVLQGLMFVLVCCYRSSEGHGSRTG